METIIFCVLDRVPSPPIEQICPVRRRRRCGALSLKREREQKKKVVFYLQNRWNEWKRSVARLTEEEKLHTRSGLFSIEFLSGTGRPFAARGPTWREHRTTFSSLSPSPYIARHRSGVNTLTVASQFPIVFFFPSPSSTFLHGYRIQPFRSISRSSFFTFIYILPSFLPSFAIVMYLIIFISRATIVISRMIAIFELLLRLANSSPRILLTKFRGGEKQGGD